MSSKSPRQTKTPQQRAEEALALANRKVKRLSDLEQDLRDQLDAVSTLLREETRLRDYAAQHPALQAPKPNKTPGTTPTQEEGIKA